MEKLVADINLTGKIVITSAGTQNVCIGTGNADAGDDNIAIGVDAGSALESGGVSNVCIGTKAGEDLTTGDKNVCIGPNAGKELTVTSNNTIIGVDAGANIAGTGIAAFLNTCIGGGTANALTTGYGNTYVGVLTDASASGAVNEVVLAGSNGTVFATGKGSHTILLGNVATGSVLPCDDNGVDLGSAALSFNDIYYDGTTLTSDQRLKENITSLSLGLGFINRLNPVSFKKKDKEEVYEDGNLTQRAITHSRKHTGLIAQEVKQVMDDMGISANDFGGYVDANVKHGIDKLFLRYEEFIAPLVKAVQELSTKLDTMQTEINNLKAE